MRTRILIFFLVPCLCGVAQQQSAPLGQNKAIKLIAEMIDSIKGLRTIRTSIKSLERINNVYSSASSEIKVNVNPRKLYFVGRQGKLEILYVTGDHSNKAIVKPHVFPYLTLTLDPRGNMMRKNQHYTIHELGFDFIGRTIALILGKEKDNMSKCMTYLGKHEHNGYSCHLLVYEAKTFTFSEYTVQRKETVTGIALKLSLNDYMLRTKNNLFNDFGYLKEGSKILIPGMYCKKAVFYIDENTMLPVSVSIYDEAGLFENYEYTNLKINKPFEENEFTKEFKGYGF